MSMLSTWDDDDDFMEPLEALKQVRLGADTALRWEALGVCCGCAFWLSAAYHTLPCCAFRQLVSTHPSCAPTSLLAPPPTSSLRLRPPSPQASASLELHESASCACLLPCGLLPEELEDLEELQLGPKGKVLGAGLKGTTAINPWMGRWGGGRWWGEEAVLGARVWRVGACCGVGWGG